MIPPGEECIHATLIRVADIGVLLTGPSGSGKSQLALELVQRGHCLAADDLVILRRHGENRLHGRAAEGGEGFLVVRGLGVLDVVKLFGPRAAVSATDIHLQLRLLSEPGTDDPLRGQRTAQCVLGVTLEALALHALRPGLATLVEVAARDTRLRREGYHAEQMLAAGLAARLRGDSSCE